MYTFPYWVSKGEIQGMSKIIGKFVFYKKIYPGGTVHTKYIEIKYDERLKEHTITHWSRWSDGSAQGHSYHVDINELLSLQKAVEWGIKDYRGDAL